MYVENWQTHTTQCNKYECMNSVIFYKLIIKNWKNFTMKTKRCIHL